MATSQRLNLTRDQLATFLKDHEQIRQFERLFAVADEIAPDVVVEVSTAAGSAQATAVQAVGMALQTAQDAAVASAAAEAKAQVALDQIAALQADLGPSASELQTLLAALRTEVEGLQMAPPPRELKSPRYGTFYDTTTQTAAAVNTAYAITFNTTDLSRGVYRGSPTSRITVDREGVYDFQFSAQLDNTSGGNHLVYIWCRINGVDVANSASQVRLKGNDGELVAAWNFVLSLKANDYFELMFSVSDTAVQILSQAAAAPVPAIPSVILTVTNNIQGET